MGIIKLAALARATLRKRTAKEAPFQALSAQVILRVFVLLSYKTSCFREQEQGKRNSDNLP